MIKICDRCKRKAHIEAKGLCKSCYNFTHHDKEKAKARNKVWHKENPLKFAKCVCFSILKRGIREGWITEEEVKAKIKEDSITNLTNISNRLVEKKELKK